MEFKERSMTVSIDTSKCPSCTTRACIDACKTTARGILQLKDGIPSVEHMTEDDVIKRGTECLACEFACRMKGLDAIRISIPIKGLDYARRLYSHVGLRPMADVDLLVPDDQLRPACALLKREAGFEEQGGAVDPRRERFYHKRVLVRRDGPATTCLDIHSVFYHPQLYRIDYDAVWDRAGSGNPVHYQPARTR